MGITSNSTTVTPGLSGKRGPTLDSGVTHLSTLGFWFGSASYHLLENSTVQIYGLKSKRRTAPFRERSFFYLSSKSLDIILAISRRSRC